MLKIQTGSVYVASWLPGGGRESMIKHDKLFVCGAFCRGMVNFRKIESFILEARPGRVRGAVVRLPVGYPAMVGGGHDWVEGELLTLKPSDVLLAMLDEFHGFSPMQSDKNLHFKQSVQVELESGEMMRAHRYVMNPAKVPKGSNVIQSGDWRSSLSQLAPLPERLTDMQVEYVQKLGGSKGREIVPIKLDLYRQLMSLELIVDKGRRLALSQLGKDVYKYIC